MRFEPGDGRGDAAVVQDHSIPAGVGSVDLGEQGGADDAISGARDILAEVFARDVASLRGQGSSPAASVEPISRLAAAGAEGALAANVSAMKNL